MSIFWFFYLYFSHKLSILVFKFVASLALRDALIRDVAQYWFDRLPHEPLFEVARDDGLDDAFTTARYPQSNRSIRAAQHGTACQGCARSGRAGARLTRSYR